MHDRVELQNLESFYFATLKKEIKLVQDMDHGTVERIGNIIE